MLAGVLQYLIRISALTVMLAISSYALANCNVQHLEETAKSQPYSLAQGLQRIVLVCDVADTAIFHFTRNYTSFAQLYTEDMQRVNALQAARVSFVLPPGKRTYLLDVNAQVVRPLDFKVSSLDEYQSITSVHTLTLSLFIGFCLALTVYVGVLGNSIRNNGFYSYSFYVLNAAIFFLLQEGLINIILPNVSVFNSYQLHVFFA
ncbi:hypothetical protein [Alteromonas gracilis]|uniref:hypothetical protein n=1 Tax=Alteromonas gracilis TaxID=1479524 RepID=UPI0030CF5B07